MDPCDVAGETFDACTEEALRRQARDGAPESQPGWLEFDGLNCVDCGEGIVAGRLLLKRCRCLDCQSVLERRRAP